MKKKINIGWIGSGFIGQVAHLYSFSQIKDLEILSLAELRPELGKQIKRKYNIKKLYKSHIDLLKNENNATLEPRITVLKKRLAEKYKKAIRVFNHWSMEEIQEMDAAFQISLKGGMRLGKETLSRLQFAGFDYEVNGSITRVAKPQREVFRVFDEEFSSFREALAFASATYKIKKSRLSQLYFDNDESFDRAIEAFHELVEGNP